MKVETKYNIGDQVWFITGNKCKEAEVIGILITLGDHRKSERYVNQEVRYNLHILGEQSYEGWGEKSVFGTKDELLKSL